MTFVSPADAYARLVKLSPDLASTITSDYLPASIEFTTTNLAAYNKIRNGSFPHNVKQMDGVSTIVFQCATLDECKKLHGSPPPVPR